MEAAQTEHGDIGYWNRVTDVNYEDGQYCGTLQEPPTVHVVDFSGYDGPLDENGFPVGLPNEIAEYMKQHGEPPTVPKIIIKKTNHKRTKSLDGITRRGISVFDDSQVCFSERFGGFAEALHSARA